MGSSSVSYFLCLFSSLPHFTSLARLDIIPGSSTCTRNPSKHLFKNISRPLFTTHHEQYERRTDLGMTDTPEMPNTLQPSTTLMDNLYDVMTYHVETTNERSELASYTDTTFWTTDQGRDNQPIHCQYHHHRTDHLPFLSCGYSLHGRLINICPLRKVQVHTVLLWKVYGYDGGC
jgi:hypothetical protein